ncbi:DUF229 domain-containing protein [candidate division KSB1 bacterium]|nr:sulfatase-like hydrolase/transferase [candidate division KSB1 bacterium]RQW06975.1 MAG: DUF229 domain-containing protein [candidate division KSB1 bacterium]
MPVAIAIDQNGNEITAHVVVWYSDQLDNINNRRVGQGVINKSMMSRKNYPILTRKIPAYAVTLSLSFLLIGIFEILNNVLFKMLHVDVFPNLLYSRFLPIVFLYFLKSLEYVAVFILFVIISLFAYTIVNMLTEKQGKNATNASGDRIHNILTALYDLLVPAILVTILFFHYDAGPAPLSYYFYFLSDTTSQTLKSFVDFSTLNTIIKIILSLLVAGSFLTFRISKYAGHYIALFLFLISLAVLPNLVYLMHHFIGVVAKVLLVLAILGMLIFIVLLMKRLFTLGIYRWLEIALVLFFLTHIAGTVYFFGIPKNTHLNIVHIILDTLRQKSFNEKTMPFLFSLKDKGVYFPNSYSSSDNTVTSHNAIYYGKHPSNVGLEHGPFPETTIMEVLRSHGYRTVVVSANGRFCIVNGFDKGVEDFYEAWKSDNHVRNIQLLTDYGLSEKFRIIEKYLTYYTSKFLNKTGYINKKPLGHREYRYFNYEPAEVVNEFVKHAIDKNPPSDPLYLFINYLDPHTPYLAPTTDYIAPVVERLKTDMPDIYHKLHFDQIALSDTLIFQQIMLMWKEVDSLSNKPLKDDFLTFCYEKNLMYLDEQMRDLFAWFEEKGMFRNTLFIVTSDHGESIGEHDLYEHGNKRLYNPEIQIPLMMLFPEQLKPIVKRTVVEINTQSVDFFPTFIDVLGITTDVELNGESLLPFILGAADSSENDYSIAEYTNVSAITNNKHKLIVHQETVEFYNVEQDPEEANNLAAQMPESVVMFKKKLVEFKKTTHVAAKSPFSDTTDESRYDPETIRLLKTLGYIK